MFDQVMKDIAIVHRALKILSPDVDPMPSDVLVEFNLPNLFDVSSTLNYISLYNYSSCTNDSRNLLY